MNMNVNRNVLDQKNYLLLDEMHEVLVGAKSIGDFDFGLEKPKNVSKEKDLNVYLVVFRVFKNNRNVFWCISPGMWVRWKNIEKWYNPTGQTPLEYVQDVMEGEPMDVSDPDG